MIYLIFSKGCKYLILRDACIFGSLNLKDLAYQSDDTKDIFKKPCRPLVFCGPPGVDISSIIKGLKRRLPNTFSQVVSHTTREPRKDKRGDKFGHNCEVEIDGVDYYFTDRISMTAAIEKGTKYCNKCFLIDGQIILNFSFATVKILSFQISF